MLVRATLVAFDAGTYTATLRLAASLSTTLAGVPVSRAIAAAELTPGRALALAWFDASHPLDAMVVGVH